MALATAQLSLKASKNEHVAAVPCFATERQKEQARLKFEEMRPAVVWEPLAFRSHT